MNTSSRATPFPQHQKHVSSITVTLTLNKNVFLHTAPADTNDLGSHNSCKWSAAHQFTLQHFYDTSPGTPAVRQKSNFAPASRERIPVLQKHKKVSSTAATSLWNPSKDLFKLTLDKHYVSVTPTFFLTTWATPQKELGKQNEGSHHAMVQHSILQRRVMVVLTIQILADHLNVSLLAHLFWRFHAKTDVASRTRNFRCMHGHIMQNHL